ncbi:MAG: hypothetical protein A2Z50_03340 [Nitrospirae bacterium RBG_19FT_COMBO_42_15]|nr:MAG: hypothetical protein A2Z50_03340 [Nitrospirae bacterium RBG_19FT_COMBO_42_15]
MQFLTDQDVYQSTINYLKNLGHNVIRAKDIGFERASDNEILQRAAKDQRILITRDKDFGALTFVTHINSSGIILLRIAPDTLNSVHEELSRFLNEHSNDNFKNCFIVIEPGRHRIRTSR